MTPIVLLRSQPAVKICIANCGQTITGSGMVTHSREPMQELSNALSYPIDAVRLPLPQNNTFSAMPLCVQLDYWVT